MTSYNSDIILRAFNFWLSVFNQTTDFLVNFISSEKDINSVQFAFTAVLTLLIPLIITLFEKRDEFNTLDKKLIGEISLIRSIFTSIVVVSTLYVLASKINQPDFYKFSSIVIIVCFGFLAVQTMRIIDFILDRDKYRAKKIKTASNNEVLDYFEDFFLGNQNSESSAKENKNFTQRQNQKIFSKEQLMVGLFTENLTNKFDKLDDQNSETLEFINEMLTILNNSLENINTSNIIYPTAKEQKQPLLQKIFEWHFKAWKLANLQLKNHNTDYIHAKDYRGLQDALSLLINQVLKLSLTKNNQTYLSFIQTLKKHLEENQSEFINLNKENQKPDNLYYSGSLNIWENFFENVSESNQLIDIQDLDRYFPNTWRTEHSFDTKNLTFKSSLTQVWWENLHKWLFNRISNSKEKYDFKISNVLRIFFPKTNQIYLSKIIFYIFKYSFLEVSRIEGYIKESPNFGWFDQTPVITQDENINIEDKINKINENKKNFTYELSYSLFKDIFTKNLPEDLAEIKNLKAKFERKAELTSEENDRFNRLKTIEEIWTKIDKKLKS